MAFGYSGSGKIKNDINVTPLVDVVLVLLIIFMVVTPMLQRGKDVRLPKGAQSESKDSAKADPLVISLTFENTLWIETRECQESALADTVKAELRNSPGRKLLLKADERLSFGDVRKVIARLSAAGVPGVGLGIEEAKQ